MYFFCFYVVLIFSLMVFSTTANAVIILDSTFKQTGFLQAENLAKQPQFKSLIYIEGDKADTFGSGAWLGNHAGHGFVLTAAHMFDKKNHAADFIYHSRGGKTYYAEKAFIHPLWNNHFEERTGYDFAIIELTQPVTDAGEAPTVYVGDIKAGQLITFMGYGFRGTGLRGEDTTIDTKDQPAAAQGMIEYYIPLAKPVPPTGDAGNHFSIWLPREDGTVANPLDDDGIKKPINPLLGLLGSGDSGGPVWMQIKGEWMIVATNSNGTGNATYGEISSFGILSGVYSWIKAIVPTVNIVGVAADNIPIQSLTFYDSALEDSIPNTWPGISNKKTSVFKN
jgi:hypothetical protein